VLELNVQLKGHAALVALVLAVALLVIREAVPERPEHVVFGARAAATKHTSIAVNRTAVRTQSSSPNTT